MAMIKEYSVAFLPINMQLKAGEREDDQQTTPSKWHEARLKISPHAPRSFESQVGVVLGTDCATKWL